MSRFSHTPSEHSHFAYTSLLLTRFVFFFFFNDTATTEIYTLSLHDALPISRRRSLHRDRERVRQAGQGSGVQSHQGARSEEHTSELQSPCNLVCRLLLEKKKKVHTERSTSATNTSHATSVYSPTRSRAHQSN